MPEVFKVKPEQCCEFHVKNKGRASAHQQPFLSTLPAKIVLSSLFPDQQGQ